MTVIVGLMHECFSKAIALAKSSKVPVEVQTTIARAKSAFADAQLQMVSLFCTIAFVRPLVEVCRQHVVTWSAAAEHGGRHNHTPARTRRGATMCASRC